MKKYDLIENTSKIYYNGSKWKSNNYSEFTIIGKLNKCVTNKKGSRYYPYCLCKFNDGTIVEAIYGLIKSGKVKNPNFPSICNIGYIGIGENEAHINQVKTKEYTAWYNMIERCYNENLRNKHPTYKDCIVCNEWHSFQNFCNDIVELENYEQWKSNKGWEIDKDIKIKGNKLYSKSTCMFVKKKENMSEMNERTLNNKLTGLTYIGISPEGNEYEFTNQHEFAELHNLNSKHINSCLKGRLKTHKKWKFKIKNI